MWTGNGFSSPGRFLYDVEAVSEYSEVLVTQSCLPLYNHWLLPLTVACQLLCSRDSPGKNIGVGSHSLFQGIFPMQGSHPSLLQWQADFYHLSHQGSPSLLYLDGKIMLAVFFPATRSWCPGFIFDHAFICYLDLILCLLKILGSPHTVSFTFCFESSDTEESDRDPRDSRAGTQSLCLRSYCFPGPEILSGNRKETPSQNIQMHKPEREISLNSRSEQGK